MKVAALPLPLHFYKSSGATAAATEKRSACSALQVAALCLPLVLINSFRKLAPHIFFEFKYEFKLPLIVDIYIISLVVS